MCDASRRRTCCTAAHRGAAAADPLSPRAPLLSFAADLVIPNSRGGTSMRSRPEEEALAKQIALHEGWVAGAGTGAVRSEWHGAELQAAYERCVPQRRWEAALLAAAVAWRARAG